MVTALQMGLPGVQELFVILLILFLLGLPIVVVVAIVLYFLTRGGDADTATGKDDRIEELEREVERLGKQVDEQHDDAAAEQHDDAVAENGSDDDRDEP